MPNDPGYTSQRGSSVHSLRDRDCLTQGPRFVPGEPVVQKAPTISPFVLVQK